MTKAVSIAQSGSNNVTMRNRIINGAMTIDQRNAGAAWGTSINGYTVDRWRMYQSTTGKVNGGQNYNSITPPAGFKNYIGVQSQSAYSIGSGDYYFLQQVIEGYNVADLNFGTVNAQPVTLSFWVRSSLTGTFGLAFTTYNDSGATSRAYTATYTINAANTWEYKTVTIPGDTGGSSTWLYTNGIGLRVNFALGVGSTFTQATGSWTSSSIIGATGSTSVVGTSGATFYVTGVQLEAGTAATPFEQRLYGTELQLCQRYYQKTYDQGYIAGSTGSLQQGAVWSSNPVTNSYPNIGFWSFAVPMRTAPTITGYNPNTGASGGFRGDGTNYTNLANSAPGERGVNFFGNNVSVGTTVFMSVHATASAEL